MQVLQRLQEIGAKPCETMLRVAFLDGAPDVVGMLMDYSDEDTNDEGVASIDIRTKMGEPYVWIREDEVQSVNLA